MLTHRLNAAQLLERLAAIMDSASDAIVGMDSRGVIETWNSAATRMFRYAAQEMIDRSIFLIVPPDLQQAERKRFERIAKGERVEPYEQKSW